MLAVSLCYGNLYLLVVLQSIADSLLSLSKVKFFCMGIGLNGIARLICRLRYGKL